MAEKFNDKQVQEINELIEKITKNLKPEVAYEIAGRDPKILQSQLKASKIDKTVKSFPCKPAYSGTVISHFIKEKGLALNKFSQNLQSSICLIY
jgi:hypothetical protein